MSLMTFLSYIVIGMFIGWLSRVIFKDRGISMMPSIAFGIIGSLVAVGTVYAMGISGHGYYAIVGAFGTLFLVNVFRKKGEPIFEDENDEQTEREDT